MNLEGRVILVTGGGRRLGRAAALALGRAGAWVAVHHHTAAREAAAVVAALEGRGTALRADLRNTGEARRLVEEVLALRGRLDGVVLSAAAFPRTPFGRVTEEAWEEVFALNLRGPFFLLQRAAPELRARRGRVVLLGDAAVGRPDPDRLPYALTKGALVTLTRGLARALAPEVLVNAVAPGPVLPPADRTPTERAALAAGTLLRRLGCAEDVAAAVRFLVEAEYVTGQVLAVDGGAGLA